MAPSLPSPTPKVPVILDRPRVLRLSNRARCEAERAICDFWRIDVSLYDVISRVPMRANDLAIIFWQMLVDDDPSLTLRDAQELMDYLSFQDTMNLLLRAWNIATPDDAPTNGQTGPEGPFVAASTGASSGAMAESN